jgi:hypothetical protein
MLKQPSTLKVIVVANSKIELKTLAWGFGITLSVTIRHHYHSDGEPNDV